MSTTQDNPATDAGTGTTSTNGQSSSDNEPSRGEVMTRKVDDLVDTGIGKTESYKRVAKEMGVEVSTVRGAYYRYARADTAKPKKPLSVEDATAQAVATLQTALDGMDAEEKALKERADEAVAEHKAFKEGMAERKKALKTKIAALA